MTVFKLNKTSGVAGIFVLSIMLFSSSCGESVKERLQREAIDSLENVNWQQKLAYEDLQRYLSVIAEGLDSISIEEGEIFLMNGDIELGKMNRQRIKQNLDHVRDLLSRHRERINQLEKQLQENGVDTKSLKSIISALRQQIETKDKELAQLRKDLDDKNKSINILSRQVQQLEKETTAQSETIQQQQEAINAQQNQLNSVYIKIASKQELKQLGLLAGGGFLKKSKLDYSKMDLSIFTKINITETKDISLPKKYKILTECPKDSYEIVANGDNSNTLRIINPTKFWSISNFLIIQTD